MNHLNQAGIGEHIYCVLCGRMAPDQKQIVRKRSQIDAQLYINILTWFVKESGHPGYLNTSIPSVKTLEANYEGGTYYWRKVLIAKRPSVTVR
jgi:hypothetical protein